MGAFPFAGVLINRLSTGKQAINQEVKKKSLDLGWAII